MGYMSDFGRNATPYRYEVVTELRRSDRGTSGRFDRLAFALRAVELLGPGATTVVVYRSTRLHVQQGRDLRRGATARWAIVGVPADATAESIALVLTEIHGLSGGPFSLELALTAARSAQIRD